MPAKIFSGERAILCQSFLWFELFDARLEVGGAGESTGVRTAIIAVWRCPQCSLGWHDRGAGKLMPGIAIKDPSAASTNWAAGRAGPAQRHKDVSGWGGTLRGHRPGRSHDRTRSRCLFKDAEW